MIDPVKIIDLISASSDKIKDVSVQVSSISEDPDYIGFRFTVYLFSGTSTFREIILYRELLNDAAIDVNKYLSDIMIAWMGRKKWS
jgi:hypothetical protein